MTRRSKIGLGFIFVFLVALIAGDFYTKIIKKRLEEIDYIEEIMTTKWGNLETHRELDGIDVKKILGGLRKQVFGTHEGYLAALLETTELFRDSHLEILEADGNERPGYISGINIVPVREGYALVACNPPADCSHLLLPLLVIEANGIPIETWVCQRANTLGGSTEAIRRFEAVINLGEYRPIGKNPPAKSVTLLLPDGKSTILHLKWKKYVAQNMKDKFSPCVVGGLHSSGTFILQIIAFHCNRPDDKEPQDALAHFTEDLNKVLKEVGDADSLLIDVRENEGGHFPLAQFALQLLIDKKTHFVTEAHLNEDGVWDDPEPVTVRPNKQWRKYFKRLPAAIVSGPLCVSACSYFAAAVKESGVAMILGKPAMGTSGGIRHYWLSASNLRLDVPGDHVWTANGKPLEGQMIEVDKEIIPSIYDYKNDPDPVLTKAIQIFRKEKVEIRQK